VAAKGGRVSPTARGWVKVATNAAGAAGTVIGSGGPWWLAVLAALFSGGTTKAAVHQEPPPVRKPDARGQIADDEEPRP
jgi:hypothetical protein